MALLVEAYWAEYLLADGSHSALREADAVLKAGASFGWARNEITADSLRARVALAEGRVDDAVRLSSRAVKQLRERGGAVPAVRSEEILLAHMHVLDAADSKEEAVAYAAEAARIVGAKGASLRDPAQRQSFTERVPLSVAALAAAEQRGAGASDA
jgi:hypothetical protein